MHCLHEAQDAQALFEAGAPPEVIRDFIDQKYGQ
jgi:hypothetical protein